jgi:alpha-L-fucosidase
MLKQWLTALAVCVLSLGAQRAVAQNFADVKPSPQQVEWQDLEIGVLVHFGPNTFMDREWGDGTADPKVFNPTALDAEQWVLAAKSAGAKYMILVAKHHDGFCLWPTNQTPYSVKASPWKNGQGNLVEEVASAARRHGLKFGVYLSPWDRHDERYKDSKAYDKYYLDLLTDLSSNYGELTEFWLDGAGSEGHVYNFDSYVGSLRTYQPNAMIFASVDLLQYGDIRWVGNESGVANVENWNVIDTRGYLRYRPAEADTPLRKLHWFWHPNDEASLKSLPELLQTYQDTVGRGAQLVIGIAPDNRGLLPETDAKRLAEFGKAVDQLYGPAKNLATQAGPAFAALHDNNPDTFWSAPPGSHSAQIELAFAKPITFDRALTMEWLNDGQLVQKYSIEVMQAGKWTTLATGTSIGHKKIDVLPRSTASRVRLNILSSAGPAHIREFQLFDDAPSNGSR